MSDFFDYWLENYVHQELAETTEKGYEKRIRLYIKPMIGDYKLKNISPAVLSELLYELHRRRLSRNTLVSVKGILTSAFDYAANTVHFISKDPAYRLSLPNKRADERVGTIRKDRIVVPPEKWEMFINKQVQKIGSGWKFRPPKYGSSRRIDIGDSVVALLERMWLQQKKDKEYCGDFYTEVQMNYDEKKGEILQDDQTQIVHPVGIRQDGNWCQPTIMNHAGRVIHGKNSKHTVPIMEQWEFHSLRHTHATNLLEHGMPMPLIQQRLGHADIKVTERYTDHVTDTMVDNLKKILE